ncbi:hypothetical protein Tco_0083738 [Tanacetum coccineum]
MVGPIMNDYISVTHKSFVSNDNDGKMIKKNFIEIEGTFLVTILDNSFNGINGENVFEHINSFLKVVELLKIRGLSHDQFRLSVFPISLSGDDSEWFTNECIGTIATWDDLVEKFVQKFYNLFYHNEEEEAKEDDDLDEIDNVLETFKIEDDLFNFDTPLCIAFEEFNYLLKINPDLFTYDVQEFKTYDEYEQDSDIDGYCNGGELPGMVRVSRMTYFQDQKWDATPGMIKFCTWLKNSFENFHELDYDVLVKLEECWWKVNTDEICLFTRWDDHLRGPYANAEPKRTYDPYLDINRISKINYVTNNVGNIQDGQRHMENLTHESSTCKIRMFKMMKYTFEADEEYVAIKELEHINHSETNVDTRYAYRELFRKMDDGWIVTRAMD